MSLRASAESGLEVLNRTNADGSAVSWLERNWPFVSWAIFLFGSGYLVATRRQRNELWLGWLSVVMYCLHQSEEHAYDLRGWRYSFVPSFNTGPLSVMFEETCAKVETSCPLDPKGVLYVNATVVWVDFSLCTIAASFNPKFLLAISLNWGMCFVNALAGHVMPALLTKSYNPGAVQSAIMAPMALLIIQRSGRPLLCIAYGIIGHWLLVMGVKITFKFQTDEALTMSAFMLFANLVLPLAISHHVATKQSKKSN